jgi:hypothetical protein
VKALRGSDLIIRGGDIGGESLLEALHSIAPAIAGNKSWSDLQPGASHPGSAIPRSIWQRTRKRVAMTPCADGGSSMHVSLREP